jgi:hypothetical protein
MPDISGNPFYMLMTDPVKGDRDKHDELVRQLKGMTGGKQNAEYGAFRDFLRKKVGLFDNFIAEAKNREFQMEQALGAQTPDTAAISQMSDTQSVKLLSLSNNLGGFEDILSTMFSAEGAAASNKTPSTETSGIYFEAQAQQRSIKALEESNGNTQDELRKLANGPVNDNAPAVATLPALAPVVNRVFDPGQFGTLPNAVVAPEKAQFRKRTPP